MWTVSQDDVTVDLMAGLRQSLGDVGVRLRHVVPVADGSSETASSTRGPNNNEITTIAEAIEATQLSGSKTTAVTRDKSGAFLLVPPYQYYFQSNEMGHNIRNIIRNDLSGVTENVDDYEYDDENGTSIRDAEAFRTYDVWMVAEFIELVQEKHPDANLFLCTNTREALDDRFKEKEKRRRPIDSVERARNPKVPMHPHQNEGIRFFLDNNGRGLLGDEMGLGTYEDVHTDGSVYATFRMDSLEVCILCISLNCVHAHCWFNRQDYDSSCLRCL